jgi:hypothetical protein
LPFELGRIKELWEQDGHFGLQRDLTNCIRIADLTEALLMADRQPNR